LSLSGEGRGGVKKGQRRRGLVPVREEKTKKEKTTRCWSPEAALLCHWFDFDKTVS
jgi:hypothetical protein